MDALIFSNAATAPGVVVTCRALGVLEIDQKKKTGDRDEIAAFFIQATAFEDKDVQVLGWQGPEQALALLGAP